MILILAAIPGSGKSTILKVVKDLFPAIDIVNYGEMMLQEASLHGLERDSLRKMPLEKQQELGLSAAHKIAQASHRLTIVDTHACVKTPVGYCPGIPFKILNALNPKGLILVQTSPHTIIERRQSDHLRQRDPESVQDLTLHQELTKKFLVSASLLTGAVLCIINNDSEEISENAQPLIKFIESLQPFCGTHSNKAL